MRPLVSSRARLVAVICYLGLPLPYGALGTGRWDGLVAYAAFPFIVRRLAGAAGVAPYEAEAGPAWRNRPAGQVAVLGALIAAASAFAPAVVPLVIVTVLAWAVGSLLVGTRDPEWWRVLVVALEAVAVALVLAAPWVIGTALAGKGSGRHLRASRGRRLGTELGRGRPLRHRAGGPLTRRVAPGGGGGAAAGARAGGQADLGGAPVGGGVRVVGPRLRRLAG